MLTASDVTSTGLTYTFTQSGDSPPGWLSYGYDYWLEQETEEGWSELEEVQSCIWYPDLCSIPAGGSSEEEAYWAVRYGELGVGRYRIGVIVSIGSGDHYTERTYYAEFDVT